MSPLRSWVRLDPVNTVAGGRFQTREHLVRRPWRGEIAQGPGGRNQTPAFHSFLKTDLTEHVRCCQPVPSSRPVSSQPGRRHSQDHKGGCPALLPAFCPTPEKSWGAERLGLWSSPRQSSLLGPSGLMGATWGIRVRGCTSSGAAGCRGGHCQGQASVTAMKMPQQGASQPPWECRASVLGLC